MLFQDQRDGLADLRFVVHDKDGDVVEPGARDQAAMPVHPAFGLFEDGGYRELHGDGGPMSFARALGADRPAVHLDQLADDGQAQPETSGPSRRSDIGLTEALEHVREELGMDADPGVGDDEARARAGAGHGHADGAPGGVTISVRDQVLDDPLDAVAIAADDRRGAVEPRGEPMPLAVAVGRDQIGDQLANSEQVHEAEVQLHVAGGRARRVEQILDQARLHGGVALDHLDGAHQAGGSSARRSCHTQPRMTLSGVRSSCDSVARN